MRVLIKNVMDQSEGRPAADESGSSRFHVRRSAHQLMTARIAPYVRSLCTSAAAPYLCFPPSVASLGDGLINGRLVICALGGKKCRDIRQENTQEFLIAFRARVSRQAVPGRALRIASRLGRVAACRGGREDGVGVGGVGGEKNACARSGCAGRGFALG